MTWSLGPRTALSPCARLLREHDRDRFLCALFAPPWAREALFSLHAFTLELARIRETVREPLLGRIRLQWWMDALESILAGRSVGHPVADALAETARHFPLDRARLETLLEGRMFDMDDEPPRDLDELEAHAMATSSTPILLTLDVLGVDSPTAREAARAVGLARALAGLARAVPYHARARRSYLPRTLCQSYSLEMEDVFAGAPSPSLTATVAHLGAVARGHLEAARALSRQIPRRAAPALLPAVLAERDLRALERHGHDPFHPRLTRPGGTVQVLTLWLHAVRGLY